jgi:hypothetical protein
LPQGRASRWLASTLPCVIGEAILRKRSANPGGLAAGR